MLFGRVGACSTPVLQQSAAGVEQAPNRPQRVCFTGSIVEAAVAKQASLSMPAEGPMWVRRLVWHTWRELQKAWCHAMHVFYNLTGQLLHGS